MQHSNYVIISSSYNIFIPLPFDYKSNDFRYEIGFIVYGLFTMLFFGEWNIYLKP